MCPLTYELIGTDLGPMAYTFQNNSKFLCRFFQRLGKPLTMALNSKKDQVLNPTKRFSYSEGVLTVRSDWVGEGCGWTDLGEQIGSEGNWGA